MLYILHGKNRNKAIDNLNKMVSVLSEKKKDAGVFRFDEENFSIDEVDYLLKGVGLFEENYIVAWDNVFGDAEAKEWLSSNLESVKNAKHIFIIYEEKIEKKFLEKLEKYAEKTKDFSEKEEKKFDGEIFKIGNEFGKRSSKNVWMCYQELLGKGFSVEEIYGTLFWQIKNIILSKNTNSAKEAGIGPFPFKNAKSFSKNFTEEELKEISSSLVKSYHLAYEKSGEREIELEKFILNL